jgi:MFS family permease
MVPKSGFYGWQLLGVLWVVLLINLAFPAYGSSVINTYMAADLHLDRKMLGLPYSIYLIMSGLPAPLVAMCVNRKGVRFTLLLGGAMVIVGSLLMGLFVSSGTGAVLAFGLVVGTGVATGGALATQTGVTRWFVRRRALALAILLSGGGIGGFIAAPLLDRVIRLAGGNWRVGWFIVAALSAIVAVVIAVFVKERPADVGQAPDGDPVGPSTGANGVSAASGGDVRSSGGAGSGGVAGSGASAVAGVATRAVAGTARPLARARVHVTSDEWTYREVLREPSLWMMLIAALGVSLSYTIFLAHGPVHLKDLGHPVSAGATAVSVATLSQLLAKVIVGAFGDQIDPRYIWAAFTALGGLGMLLIAHATGANDVYAFAICLGAGFGGMIVCLMAVLSNYYGTKVYPSVVGLALAIQTTFGSTSPIVAGWAYDRYGTYNYCFYFIAAVCFGGVVLLLAIRPPRRRVNVPAAAGVSS